ncbi:LysR family transcriptional regulator [Marinobacter fonticola]|uniref:LysR family transcriptional regulator n=1 Tax=Marinobacter fonticola TaxID=2603215 RepID=UPI0011E89A6A|nr:LysR family transcriptional regulator [Marinobacter fonticola]
MNIKLDKLRSFVLVADEGNLTRAAHRRHTTPSAVSEHLRQLEDHFGVPLFERSSRGMKLTPEGRKLVMPARQALLQVAELDEIARTLRCEKPARLFLGLNAPPEYLKVDQLLRQVARDIPEVSLELGTSASYLIADQVGGGKMDLGFVYGDVLDDRIQNIRLSTIRICIVGPMEDGLEALPQDPKALQRLPWIWPSCSCPFDRLMPEIIGCGRDEANAVSTSEDEHTTLSMIRAGIGYGILEYELAKHWADRGSVRIYEKPDSTVSLNLLVRRDQLARKPIHALVELVRQLWAPEHAVLDSAEAISESVANKVESTAE